MRKRQSAMIIAGIGIFLIVSALFLVLTKDSRQQAGIIKSFLESLYNTQDYQSYEALMAGDLEAPKQLYEQKYQKLITADGYELMAANRFLYDSERTAKEHGCGVSLLKCKIKKKHIAASEKVFLYGYEITVKLDYKDGKTSQKLLTGTLTLIKENQKWIVSRFMPNELLYASVEGE